MYSYSDPFIEKRRSTTERSRNRRVDRKIRVSDPYACRNRQKEQTNEITANSINNITIEVVRRRMRYSSIVVRCASRYTVPSVNLDSQWKFEFFVAERVSARRPESGLIRRKTSCRSKGFKAFRGNSWVIRGRSATAILSPAHTGSIRNTESETRLVN